MEGASVSRGSTARALAAPERCCEKSRPCGPLPWRDLLRHEAAAERAHARGVWLRLLTTLLQIKKMIKKLETCRGCVACA